ncbi:MAG TPA: glycosyltransferase family 1 protein [Tepidisphaeraceae bacterium]|jgi:glycosyltransferase involved in cell wall biosynthesis
MKVYGYTQVNGVFAKPTGVAKHIDQMFHGLARTPGVDFSMVMGNDQQLEQSPLHDLPAIRLPYARKKMEICWSLFGRPRIDKFCRDADWIYTPFESAVTSKQAQVASTLHSLYYFDKSLPGYETRRHPRIRFRFLLRSMVRNRQLILTVSEFLKRQVIEWFGADPSRVIVVGNGAEPEFFEAGRQPYMPQDRPYVVAVSGLNFLDGAQYVIPVARALLKKDPNLLIKVAGHQHEQEFLDQAKVLPNIQLLGYQQSKQLAALMHDSVALLFLNRYETFGMGVVEAMAAGTPVIGTNFTAVPEIVANAGMIVEPEKPEEVTDQILTLARTPSARASLIEAGARRALDFTWESCLHRLLAALRNPPA